MQLATYVRTYVCMYTGMHVYTNGPDNANAADHEHDR